MEKLNSLNIEKIIANCNNYQDRKHNSLFISYLSARETADSGQIIIREIVKKLSGEDQEIQINFFKSKREVHHILIEIVCQILSININDGAQYIQEKITKFEALKGFDGHRSVKLLELLGILPFKGPFFEKSQTRDRVIIQEFAIFLAKVAKYTFSQQNKPLILTLNNIEFIKKASFKFFLQSLKSIHFKSPINIFLSSSFLEESFQESYIVDLLHGLELKTAQFFYKKQDQHLGNWLLKQLLKLENQQTHNQIMVNSSYNILQIAELSFVYKASHGYVENKQEYQQYISDKLEYLSEDEQLFLKFLVFMEGKIEKKIAECFFGSDTALSKDKIYKLQSLNLIYINKYIYFASNILLQTMSSIFEKDILSNDHKEFFYELINRYGESYRYRFLKVYFLNKLEVGKSLGIDILLKNYLEEQDYSEAINLLKVHGLVKNYLYDYCFSLFHMHRYQEVLDIISRELEGNLEINSQIHYNALMGRCLLSLNKIEEGLKQIYVAYILAKKEDDIQKQASLELLLGDVYKTRNDSEKSLSMYHKALRYYKPEEDNFICAQIYNNIAEINIKENLDHKRSMLDLAIFHNDRDITNRFDISEDIWYNYAEYFLLEKDYSSALKAIETAWKYCKENYNFLKLSKIYFLYAEIKGILGDFKKSKLLVQKSLGFTKEYNFIKNKLEFNLRKCRYFWFGQNFKQLRIFLEKGIRSSSQVDNKYYFSRYMLLSGELNIIEKQFEKASRCLHFCLQQSEEVTQTLFLLVRFYIEKKDKFNALRMLEKIKNKSGKNFKNNILFNYNNYLLEIELFAGNLKVAEQLLSSQKKMVENIYQEDIYLHYLRLTCYFYYANSNVKKGEEVYRSIIANVRKNGNIVQNFILEDKLFTLFLTLGHQQEALDCMVKAAICSKELFSPNLVQYSQEKILNISTHTNI